MNEQKVIKNLFWGLALVTTIVVMPYIWIFGDGSFSNDKTEWGAFGDYFGGIINPLIGMANLFFLIKLTFTIDGLEDNRRINDLNNQKYLTLYTIRHDSLKMISSNLEKVQLEIIERAKDSGLKLLLIRNEISSFVHANDYIFPSLKEEIHESLNASIEELSALTIKYYETTHVDKNFDLGMKIHKEEIIPKLQSFINKKVDFIRQLQQDILNTK